MKTLTIFGAAALAVMLQSCSYRLLDFTVISTKTVAIRTTDAGKRVTGEAVEFLGIGVHVTDAVDCVVESAGPGYDALIDGVVYNKIYPFVSGFVVEGTAINTSTFKTAKSDTEWLEFSKKHNLQLSTEENVASK
jgi:hypothetical protein